jgi:hypothetical protein
MDTLMKLFIPRKTNYEIVKLPQVMLACPLKRLLMYTADNSELAYAAHRELNL